MRTLLLFLSFCGISVASEYCVTLPSGKELDLTVVEIPEFRKSEVGSIFGDVLSHSKDTPFGGKEGRGTNVHETVHGIHSYLRVSQGKNAKVGGFYLLEGRAIILQEPKIKRSSIKDFVPESLRNTSGRYNSYLVNPPKAYYINEKGQKIEVELDDNPLYITDEWVAYTLGGMTHVEDFKAGRYEGLVHNGKKEGVGQDALRGILDFTVFQIALCMAVEKNDPDYWRDNKQFRNFTELMLHQSNAVFDEGHDLPPFRGYKQTETLELLRISPDCSEMRDFLRNNFGGIWLN